MSSNENYENPFYDELYKHRELDQTLECNDAVEWTSSLLDGTVYYGNSNIDQQRTEATDTDKAVGKQLRLGSAEDTQIMDWPGSTRSQMSKVEHQRLTTDSREKGLQTNPQKEDCDICGIAWSNSSQLRFCPACGQTVHVCPTHLRTRTPHEACVEYLEQLPHKDNREKWNSLRLLIKKPKLY